MKLRRLPFPSPPPPPFHALKSRWTDQSASPGPQGRSLRRGDLKYTEFALLLGQLARATGGTRALGYSERQTLAMYTEWDDLSGDVLEAAELGGGGGAVPSCSATSCRPTRARKPTPRSARWRTATSCCGARAPTRSRT